MIKNLQSGYPTVIEIIVFRNSDTLIRRFYGFYDGFRHFDINIPYPWIPSSLSKLTTGEYGGPV